MEGLGERQQKCCGMRERPEAKLGAMWLVLESRLPVRRTYYSLFLNHGRSEGDRILFHSRISDEWYEGENERTGKTGMFPLNFVEVAIDLP